MKKGLAIGLLLMLTVTHGSGFGLMGGLLANPSTALNAARYMTQVLMRNMAQQRTSSVPCIEHVSRSTVTFFNEASVSLQLGRLLQMAMRRASAPGSDAMPLAKFCQMANVRRLRKASVTFVSQLTCLGGGAVDDTDRLFRSLVFIVEHVCRDGGHAATQFVEDAQQCRRLDAQQQERMDGVKVLRRDRRSETARPRVLSTTTTTTRANSTRLLATLISTTTAPTRPTNKTTNEAADAVADNTADAEADKAADAKVDAEVDKAADAEADKAADAKASKAADAKTDKAAEAKVDKAAAAKADKAAAVPPALLVYSSLQACFEDVSELLPPGTQLSPQEELTDYLLTLPALLPRLLEQDGLLQFCPALLKGADCAHLAFSQCPERTQRAMARFFQGMLRGILCDNMPDDEVLKQLIWSDEVKKEYLGL